MSPGVIDGLVDEGTLEVVELPPQAVAVAARSGVTARPTSHPHSAPPQQSCGGQWHRAGSRSTLIDGVTGSGKTEVYFEAVAETIRTGRQCLILLPEIALTAQFLDRFAARFGVRPAEWHSQLSPRRRARTWQAVTEGEVLGGGGRALGAVPALRRPRPDRGR